ncbi:methylated-DNA-protein-cysteine methyltransferase [Ignicoccus pacificus DSM 13166]|uniref:Methylated-DNA-protein-cysteine methyltransferase n=1 Tax=Ignicoccus pacificus DSM 13166 TaxID=940294 RepID=A0A977KA89_9CREN|nr:methylated-DNA-protein-cysteine methyltransferase [Ignicoccus pacificus DSM 13166]
MGKIRKEELLKILLLLIPRGKVTTYKSLANILKTSPRAVGKLLNSNEELVVIPCHRVVMSNGKIGGYKLGESFKRKLLVLEGVHFCGNRVCKEDIIDLFLELEGSDPSDYLK